MLQRLAGHPASNLTCVDPFELLHPEFQANRLRFLRNTAATGAAAKLTLLQERSEAALPRLLAQGGAGSFDLAYVDGSHLRADVLLDGVLAWRLLKPGGFLVFDDYEWDEYRHNPACHPKQAVDAFVEVHRHQLQEVFRGYQVIVRKAGESAA